MSVTQANSAAAPEIEHKGPVITDGYRSYAMVVLLIIYILNFVDRQVINILAEPIKNELGLLDWQLGLMTGLAFALFYTFLGLPIARLAERQSRPMIISVSLAIWSGFTALSGFAQSFVHLILARIGVGIGEAGCTPAAHSLISDYVPKEKRASALAFYSLGVPLGSLVGMGIGGMIADAHGWRMAFIVCGVPGVVFALISAFTLIEPRAKSAMALIKERAAAAPRVTYRAVIGQLLKKRTFGLIALGAAIKAFIGYGHAPFTASFFYRNHAQEVAALAGQFGLQSGGFLGLALGLVAGIGGAIGTILGGQIADHFGKKDLRAWVSVPAIASLVTIPIYFVGITSDNVVLVMSILSINAILGSLWYGPIYATAQSVAPIHIRATASAVMLFIINLIGLGLGPLIVGGLSDFFAIGMGMGKAQGVLWALMTTASMGVFAFLLFWMARDSIREDMES